MFELIDQCNKILVHKGNGYNESPYVEPAHEVDHSAIAALLAQSKSLCAQAGFNSLLVLGTLLMWKAFVYLRCAHLQAA